MSLPNRHGVQGQLDRASKGVLENEFGSSKDDDVVTKILEKGDVQETKVWLCTPSLILTLY
jgi:hypothetical protein